MIKTLLAVAIAAAAVSNNIPRPPLDAVGDVAALHYEYVGHVSPDGSVDRIQAGFAMHQISRAGATVTVSYNDKNTQFPVTLGGDRTLTIVGKTKSDLVPMYNAIPLIMDTTPSNLTAASAIWNGAVPVKVSQTEWKNIPVRVSAKTRGGNTILHVAGAQRNIVTAEGFTVAEDVTVSGDASFTRGRFSKAQFSVREAVHAYKDIPISYEWSLWQ